MLEFLLASSLTILPDFLYRRFVQGKRIGRQITLFSLWYELRLGITACVLLTLSLITVIFYFHPSTSSALSSFRTVPVLPETVGRVAEVYVGLRELEEAAVELAKTTVYAGVTGRLEQFTLRPGDLVNPMMRPAGILVPSEAGRVGLQAGFGHLEPLFTGGLTALPPGSSCIVNVYTSNHEKLKSPDLGTLDRVVLHVIDGVGVVHAAILRL